MLSKTRGLKIEIVSFSCVTARDIFRFFHEDTSTHPFILLRGTQLIVNGIMFYERLNTKCMHGVKWVRNLSLSDVMWFW